MLIVRIGSVFEMSHEVLMIVSGTKCAKSRVFMKRFTITIFFKMVHLYKPHILYIWFIHCHTGCLLRQYLILPENGKSSGWRIYFHNHRFTSITEHPVHFRYILPSLLLPFVCCLYTFFYYLTTILITIL